MRAIDFSLLSAGVVAPGLESLAALRALDQAGQAFDLEQAIALPGPSILPPNERRRSTQAIRLALACAERALAGGPVAAQTIRTVFASDEGTGEVCAQMLEALATTRQVSPLTFPNSVLNAGSGYFSIGFQNQSPSMVVSQGADSFAAGLLCALGEAIAWGEPVMLIAYDPVLPSPLDECLAVRVPTGLGMIIEAGLKQDRHLGRFRLRTEQRPGYRPRHLPAWIPDHWKANSSVPGLALLSLTQELSELELPLGGLSLFVTRTDGDRLGT